MIDNYLQYHFRQQPSNSQTKQQQTAGNNTERMDYYKNQGRPPDKVKLTQTTLQEYKFTSHPN
eukprot:12880912-Ditylum_brightwellii.AAC.1